MSLAVDRLQSEKGKKILFIDHDNGYTGSTVSLIYLVKFFIEKGFYVTILTNKKGVNKKIYNAINADVIEAKFNMHLGVHFNSADNIFSLKGLYSLLLTVNRFIMCFMMSFGIIRKINPSIIYINEYVSFPISITGKILKKTVVCHVRSQMIRGHLGFRRKIIQFILTHTSDKILAISEQDAEQFYNYEKYLGEKIYVVKEFLDDHDFITAFDKDKLKTKLDIPTNKFILLTLGGFKSLKDTLDILKALNILIEKDKDIYLIVVGKDDSDLQNKRSYLNKCLKYINEHNLQNYLKMFGILENVNKFMNICDVLINASTDTHFSRPIIEAWAKKKPIISSRLPHTEEFVDENTNGLLYEPGNFEELSQIILLLKNDKELGEKMGEYGLRKAKEQFYAKVNCERVLNIIMNN